jgi:hypothetical protein
MLRGLFGPSKAEIWSQIAADIGADYIEGGWFKGNGVVYQHGEWKLVLDTYTTSDGDNSSTTYTRLRAPFVNKDGLYFKIYRTSFFSSVGKFFGMEDIEIGDPFFDDSFIIKGNNQQQLIRLLSDPQLKHLMHEQSRIHLEIRDDEGWFGPNFPDGVDELYFSRVGVMRDVNELKALFELFTHTLTRLVQIDSAYEDDPNVELKV